MAEVTFDVELGGDGSVVTDDADPTTGLANGGHRERFVPALAQTVVMAGTAKNQAAAASSSASTASTKANEADQSAQAASSSASTASTKANDADQSAQAASSSASTASTKANEADQSAQAAASSKQAAEDLYGDLSAVDQAKADAEAAATTANNESGAAEQSAQTAANEADTATQQATLAGNAAAAASTSETNASGYATTAQQARDAALTSSAIYTDTSSGLGQTPSGEHFSVPSTESDEYLVLYLNDGGVAVEVKRYPSALALETLATEVLQLLQQVVATNDLAAQAARQIESRIPQPLSESISNYVEAYGIETTAQVASAIEYVNGLAAQAARMVSGGEIELRDGSAELPALAHHGDRDTGVFFPGADAIALAVAGLEALRLDPNGRLGIGTNTPSSLLDVNDDRLRVRETHTPSSANDTGNKGDIAWDSDHVYICVNTNTWKRSALSSW